MSRVPDDLLRAACAGDPAALDAVLRASQPDIRRYARRQCRDAGEVDDAIQESLILLYRKIGALRSIDAFSHWLFRIVDRVCLRFARRLVGAPSLVDELDETRLSRIDDATVRLDLAAAIESLPDHYRAVLVMRDVNERTIDELAAELGATRQAVKARLRRARLLVREYILR